jgi:hypothetical protein
MICSNCLMKKLEKDRKKAMKRYTEKLRKEKHGSKNNGLSGNKPKK